MIPVLPMPGGGAGGWLVLGLKMIAAMGFMAAADLVMLYAC
jgi:hypothetical protein